MCVCYVLTLSLYSKRSVRFFRRWWCWCVYQGLVSGVLVCLSGVGGVDVSGVMVCLSGVGSVGVSDVLVCTSGVGGVGVSGVLVCKSGVLVCLSGVDSVGVSAVVLVHHLPGNGAAVVRSGDGRLHLHRSHRHR